MDKQKALSPGRLTARRFFRNRLAVTGLGLLAFMFLFSFVGGALSPYSQSQVFYREELRQKEVASAQQNLQYRFYAPQTVSPVLQAQFSRFLGKEENFTYQNTLYRIATLGKELYGLYQGDSLLCLAALDIITTDKNFLFVQAALTAYTNHRQDFLFQTEAYRFDGGDILGREGAVGHISRWLVSGAMPRDFQAAALSAIEAGQTEFTWDSRSFDLQPDTAQNLYSLQEETKTRVWDSYAAPSRTHLLGTDKNGMDVLTRLQYGGRVSLVIGFLVVLLSGLLGMLFGGISGYFGGFLDNLIMRLVDIFYCIPTTPLLIILGAALDGMRVDPKIRMVFLMLTLGFLGWPGIARLVRGQILSLREQEFMTATEACGIRVSRRIFRHLLPNVIPQLIVTCTMQLGSTILTEATLSFLGLGVKFPFASWGNIMNDVANVHVLTSYLFVWLPAGVCLVLSVLGFNFVGDGLRDAFDPRMKR
ncbi:MAG: ABC transporter permease [Oscillospiraceae bacterium]|nr:ABC transporter permease [Oscillospiraceae bacterium]